MHSDTGEAVVDLDESGNDGKGSDIDGKVSDSDSEGSDSDGEGSDCDGSSTGKHWKMFRSPGEARICSGCKSCKPRIALGSDGLHTWRSSSRTTSTGAACTYRRRASR